MNSDQLLTSYEYSSCFGNTAEQHAKTQSLNNIKSEFTQGADRFTAPHSTDTVYPGYPNILDANSNWTTMPCYNAATDNSKSLNSELSSLLPYHGPLTDHSTDNSEDNHRFSFLHSQGVENSMLAHPTYMPGYGTTPSTYQELIDSSSGVNGASSTFPYPFTNTIPREAHGQSGMFHFAVHPFSNYYSHHQSRAFSLPENSAVQDSLNSSLSSIGSTANALDQAAVAKHPNKAQMSQTNKPKRKRIATAAQRRAANIRERRRMYSLNESFDSLRKKVPTFAYEKRLSRIETLRLAITYIAFMTDLLQGKQPQQIRLVSRKSNNLLCQVAQQHLFNQQNRTPLLLTSPTQSEPSSTLPAPPSS